MNHAPAAHSAWRSPARNGGWPLGYSESAALRLSDQFRPALRAHFAKLSAEDLYLRFGAHCRPEVLDTYVAGIDFSRSIVLGVFDDELELIGAAHLSPEGAGWELGLSVLVERRGRGVGTSLLRRAMQQVRLARADRISVHCLSDNHALIRLIKKVGAEVIARDGESDGVIVLPHTLPFNDWGDLAEEQIAAFNFALKAQMLMARLLVQQFGRRLPKPRIAN
jgi:RimJ/RimL family protein N-acetyltransferase